MTTERLNLEGTFNLHVLRLVGPDGSYVRWAGQTDIWPLLPDEYRAVHPKPITNGELMDKLPRVVYDAAQIRSRAAQRIDEVASPLQQLFAGFFLRSIYEIKPVEFDPASRVGLVSAAVRGESALERTVWFYNTFAAEPAVQFGQLDVVFADYRHADLRSLDCSFAYVLFFVGAGPNGPRMIACDLDLVTTDLVRNQIHHRKD